MKNTTAGQVQFSELIFTMSWEDPAADRKALAIRPTDTLVGITSGGCNIFGFLLDNPREVFAIDINPLQSHLLELKIAAMKGLNHGEFLEFLGVRSSDKRVDMFEAVKRDLSPAALAYWNRQKQTIKKGILGSGRYENFIRLFRKVLTALQGNRRIEGLFQQGTLEAQQDYFNEVWNTRRWRAIFKIFFNKHMLARRGLSADYFQFDDGSGSFAESFFRRSRRAMTDMAIQPNYFLSQYLLGRYLSEQHVPDYLRREHYDLIKSRLDRVSVISADLKEWLAQQSEGTFGCFSLSNICEVMDVTETNKTFEHVLRTSQRGARICFRNLMIPRTIPEHLMDRIARNTELSKQLLLSDSSFVYSRVDALNVS